MELLVEAGLIFSEALCQAYNSSKAFLTDYDQTISRHVACMKECLLKDKYSDKSWPERITYYDLKIDEMVGKLLDEQLVKSKAAE